MFFLPIMDHWQTARAALRCMPLIKFYVNILLECDNTSSAMAFFSPQALFLISMCCFDFTAQLEWPHGACMLHCHLHDCITTGSQSIPIRFLFLLRVFSELETNSFPSSKCGVFFWDFHSAGVKSLDKHGQYTKMEKTVKPLRFCANERMGRGGVSQTDDFDNLRWIETKNWKYKSLRNIYFGQSRTFRRREPIAALWLEWNM